MLIFHIVLAKYRLIVNIYLYLVFGPIYRKWDWKVLKRGGGFLKQITSHVEIFYKAPSTWPTRGDQSWFPFPFGLMKRWLVREVLLAIGNKRKFGGPRFCTFFSKFGRTTRGLEVVFSRRIAWSNSLVFLYFSLSCARLLFDKIFQRENHLLPLD